MKLLFLVLFISVTTLEIPTARANNDHIIVHSVPNEAVAKDFTMVCEISAMAKKLAASAEFKKDSLDREGRITSILATAIRTPEVKNVLQSTSISSAKQRIDLWHQSAKAMGLTNWKCDTLSALY